MHGMIDEEIRRTARNAARSVVEQTAGPDVLYSVHGVDITTHEADPQMLWSGQREPTVEEIAAATMHEGGIVRYMTRDGASWDFGAGWHENAEDAIAAALP